MSQDHVVRVYNWMLEEHQSIILDHQSIIIGCLGWADSENIVISGCERFLGDGVMGVFDAYKGELKHKFLVNHKKQKDVVIERYTAGAMSFGPDYKLFASCICTGISNQITEKPREYFIEGYGLAVADRNRRPNPIDKSLGIGV